MGDLKYKGMTPQAAKRLRAYDEAREAGRLPKQGEPWSRRGRKKKKRAKRRKKLVEKRLSRGERRAAYRLYLKSDDWKEKREQKLADFPYCEECGTKKRLQVHHLRYRKLYDVRQSDLMTLCRTCHKAVHEGAKV